MPKSPTGGQDLTVQPPHVADEEKHRQVRTMSACGLSIEQVCDILPCRREDFDRCYANTYKNGLTQANVQVGAQVLQAATDKNHGQFFQCASFWLRARAGWRDVREIKTEQAIPEQQKQALIDAIIDQVTTTNVADLHRETVKK